MNIHISRNGEQFGPYSPEQVREYLSAGTLLASDLAWHEGAPDWVPVTQLVEGATAPAGVPCPKCGAALDPTDVVCLACGHNLDEPELTDEQKAAIAAAEAEANRVKIPMPLTYEDETSVRASAVNSVGYGLLVAFILPVFGTGGEWSIPGFHMWDRDASDYTWQMQFDSIAPTVAGLVCVLLASMMHGRGRGVVMLSLGAVIVIAGLAVPEAGQFQVVYLDDNSTTPTHSDGTPWKPPDMTDDGIAHIPKKSSEKKVGNQFFDLVMDPAKYTALVLVFLLAWIGVVGGSRVRYFRPESFPAYIMALVGAGAVCLMWVLPVADGKLPLMVAIEWVSNDPMVGAGLLVMLAMQIGAAVLCFMNRRRIRPSLMKKYSNLAGMLMMISIMVPVLPLWGQVVYEQSNKYTELAEKRYKYVSDQTEGLLDFGGYGVKQRERSLRNLEKPINARISSIFGWFATGAKYMAWLGGLILLFPVAIGELACGKREPDGQYF